MKSSLRSFIGALALAFLIVVGSIPQIGCNPPPPETINRLAKGGRTAASVLDANETLPDQLLSAGVIKEDVHKFLVSAMAEARADVKLFNDGMDKIIESGSRNLKPLLPVALRLVKRIHALNRTDIPGWHQVFAAAEVGITVIANYFAISVAKLRKAGFTDPQICVMAGVQYDASLLKLIDSYAEKGDADAGE